MLEAQGVGLACPLEAKVASLPARRPVVSVGPLRPAKETAAAWPAKPLQVAVVRRLTFLVSPPLGGRPGPTRLEPVDVAEGPRLV